MLSRRDMDPRPHTRYVACLDRYGEPDKAAPALLNAIETNHVLFKRDMGFRLHTGYITHLDR
jgi:hypothetical protein